MKTRVDVLPITKELPANLDKAVKKDEYMEKIKAVGFQDVQVIDETISQVELMANDLTVNKIIENLGGGG